MVLIFYPSFWDEKKILIFFSVIFEKNCVFFFLQNLVEKKYLVKILIFFFSSLFLGSKKILIFFSVIFEKNCVFFFLQNLVEKKYLVKILKFRIFFRFRHVNNSTSSPLFGIRDVVKSEKIVLKCSSFFEMKISDLCIRIE